MVLDVFLEGNYDLQGIFGDLQDLLENITAFAPEMTLGANSTQLSGLFGVISDLSQFSSALVEFLEIVDLIEAEIDPELMAVLRHASVLSPSELGCQQLSSTFTEYTETLLGISNVSNPCDFLPEIKQKLNYSADLLNQDNVTLQNLVEFSGKLQNKIDIFFGYEFDDVEKIVKMFGMKSARRLMDAIKEYLLEDQAGNDRRRLSSSYDQTRDDSYTQRSMGVMREVRRTFQEYASPVQYNHRRLLDNGGDPLLSLTVNDLLRLSFDVNFGGGAKVLLFSIDFDVDPNKYVILICFVVCWRDAAHVCLR